MYQAQVLVVVHYNAQQIVIAIALQQSIMVAHMAHHT
jgi:hypothetical protein